jgi:hypothetical protein
MRSRRVWLNGEPSLQEMLSDEVVQAVMRRDGVRRDDLLALIRRIQRVLRPEGVWPVVMLLEAV